ncbi:hypothetical protein ES703_17055 [subsurface metagenome]
MARTKRVYKRLWNTVRQIIRANYELIATQSIRGVKGSRGIRASYYIVGDLLEPYLQEGKITREDYDWYISKQGYASYRDDIWPKLEQQEGLKRPEAKALGIVYDQGTEYPISHLINVWDQARGFIFVEKAGDAELIQELSDFGWTIVAGQGYPTRLMRQLLKQDTRDVMAMHDWDRDGLGIYRALGFTTRRTWHLDIDLGNRVIDIGLNKEDIEALDLPTRPGPKKYGGAPRAEISALHVLTRRWGIENPVLAYAVASLLVRGYRLSPTEKPKEDMARAHLQWALTEGIRGVVTKAVKAIMAENKIEGNAVTGTLNFDKEIKMPGLQKALETAGKNILKEINWRDEDSYHDEALHLTDDRIVERLRNAP